MSGIRYLASRFAGCTQGVLDRCVRAVVTAADLDEVVDLALGELVEESGVALIEWGELAATVFGRDVMTIDFVVDDEEKRTLIVDGALAHERMALLEEWAAS